MKKSMLLAALCFLLVILGCSNIKLPGISSGSNATPTPSTASNTIATAPSETNGSPTNSATNSETTMDSDASTGGEYADVPEKECRLYLATLKNMSECRTFTEKQRQDFAKIYADTLKNSKAPAKTKELADLKDSICKMTNEAMKPTADRCRQ